MGDPRTRPAADLEPGQGGPDRRCLPSDDTLYGAGRGDLDRGCRRAGPLPEGRGRFRAPRKPRTSKIQEISSANTWMSGGNDDPSWLYGYDAWNVSLDAPAPTPGSSPTSAAART